MKTEARLQDPVFQINLLIWMAKEQPSEGYRVKPLFWESGYSIIYIEKPFPFPVPTFTAIQESGMDISQEPEPELLLSNQNALKGLYFEAKATSFGVESSNSRQARAHLIATGPAFAEVLAPLKSGLLCYVLPANACDTMHGCLSALSEELSQKHLRPGQFSVHGLSYRDAQIMYGWDDAFATYCNHAEREYAIMEQVSEEVDPCPLLLVFSDEDCPDSESRDFYRRAVVEQVHARLLSELSFVAVNDSYVVTSDELLVKTSDGVFDFLGRARQKGLRNLVRENILKRIANEWKDKPCGVIVSAHTLTVTWETSVQREAFLDWLESRHTDFAATKPEEDRQMFIEEWDESE